MAVVASYAFVAVVDDGNNTNINIRNKSHARFSDYRQIFRQLELPAERDRINDLRTNVAEQRRSFVYAITNNSDLRNLDELVAFELAKYEKVRMGFRGERIKLNANESI